MANECYFLLKAVSRKKEVLERLVKLMNYEDPEGLFVYRVRDISTDKPPSEEAGGFWSVEFSGDVAWSDHYWFHDYYTETDEMMRRVGFPEEALHRDPDDEKMRKNFRIFPQLCKDWGFGVESWTEELGCQFQGHTVCTAEGKLVRDEELPYSKDEHGHPEKGYEGFGDGWGDWLPPETIYGKRKEDEA